jgi:hypothetical protein
MPKLELQMPNPDKPGITNYKHQITNKFQISISKSQIKSNAIVWTFEFWSLLFVWYLCFVI